MPLKFFGAFMDAAAENSGGGKISGDFHRQIWPRENCVRILWKDLIENFAHSHSAAVFDSFCAAQKDGFVI